MLGFGRERYSDGGDKECESLGWNSERPQKTSFVQLDESQRVAQGHSPPRSPHNVHSVAVQIVREKVRVDPAWAKTPVFHQTNTHV